MATQQDILHGWPALHSLDLGSVISPDGRDTPLVPTMPIVMSDAGPDLPTTAPSPTSASSSTLSGLLPEHFGARVAVGAIAVIVIILVVVRVLAPAAPAVAAAV